MQQPFINVDEQGRVYLNETDANRLKEIESMIHILYRRVVEFGLVKINESQKKDSYVQIDGAEPELIWDPGVSVPEAFSSQDDFQETVETIHGHEVKFTGKDRGYIDGKFFERTEFLRRLNCYRNGWETPDDAVARRVE